VWQCLNFDATYPIFERTRLPYCHRCGAQLDEGARFCHKCGAPVITYIPPAKHPAKLKPWYKDHLIVVTIGLVVILLSAVVVIAFLVAPASPWHFEQQRQDNSPNVNTINLTFEADVGQVNIIPIDVNNNILIYVSANGSRGISTSTDDPVEILFDNQTSGEVLTVTSRVTLDNRFSFGSVVTCTIYVKPTLNLNLNVTSQAGQVSFSVDKAAVIQSLNLHTNAGEVEANLQGNLTLAGNVSLTTNAGSVNFRMNEIGVNGNCTVALDSNLGSVYADITQTKTMTGNIKVNAATNAGSVNVGLEIDAGVGAQIASHTNLGDIDTDLKNFSGNESLIESNNYPAPSNIEITNHTNLGGINIQATYQTTTIPT
jgi:hypothetical protein